MARPQQFDRAEVLKAAMEVFHRQGYGATSVPDLVDATHLQPGSIYAAFGNKKGLLMESLHAYCADNLAGIDQTFAEAATAMGGIRRFLMDTGAQCDSEDGRYGCFMINILLEMATQDPELGGVLRRLMSRIEKRVTDQLQRAKEQGELDADQDPKALAKFVLSSIWGLRVLGKTKPEPGQVKLVVDQVISHLEHGAAP